MQKIKIYILPTLLYTAVVVSLYFIYQTQIKILSQDISAREIDPNCDIVMFSTEHCSYCKKARKYLTLQGVTWCERDIQWSDEDAQLFKQLGGKGTPLTVIGNVVIGSFVENRFKKALEKLKQL